MRAFNLLLFFIVVLALVLVVGVALTNGGITLGGYPGPSQPQKIQLPQPQMP